MSTDFEDKEREFLESLKADTGRDLGEWMSAIRAQGLPHRNDVIDWLRQQGFIFSWASWLERIHANGGRPIYLSVVPDSLPITSVRSWTREGMSSHDGQDAAGQLADTEAQPPRPARPSAGRPFLSIVRSNPQPASMTPRPKPADTAAAASARYAAPRVTAEQRPRGGGTIVTPDQAALNATIARAKAYAPLAGFLLRQIAGALPNSIAVAARDHISLHAGDAARPPFGVLAVSSRELRLALGGLEPVEGPPLVAGRLTGGAQAKAKDMACYVVLTDARQLDDRLIGLIVRACSQA